MSRNNRSRSRKTVTAQLPVDLAGTVPASASTPFGNQVNYACATDLPMLVSTGKGLGNGVGGNNNLPPIAVGDTGRPDDYVYLLVVQPAQLELLTDVLTDLLTEYRGATDRKELVGDLQKSLQALKHAGVSGVPLADVEAGRRLQLFESNQTR
jgi:hypothetical protein